MKYCKSCNEIKQKQFFSKNKRSKDGYARRCKACDRAYYLANSKWLNANSSKYRSLNKDKIKARKDAYRSANPEKYRSYSVKSAQWKAENKARVSEYYSTYRKANSEKIRSYISTWAKENPELRRIHSLTRRVRKRGSGGKLSSGIVDKLFKLQRGLCACCGELLGIDYHVDHIMPLALGGSNTDDNIQLLRAICNQQKYTKHPVDFMQSRGLLL